jgi:hypothetical protein
MDFIPTPFNKPRIQHAILPDMAQIIDDSDDEELKRAIAMSLGDPEPTLHDDEDDEDFKRALAMSLEDSGATTETLRPQVHGPFAENSDGKALKPCSLVQYL